MENNQWALKNILLTLLNKRFVISDLNTLYLVVNNPQVLSYTKFLLKIPKTDIYLEGYSDFLTGLKSANINQYILPDQFIAFLPHIELGQNAAVFLLEFAKTALEKDKEGISQKLCSYLDDLLKNNKEALKRPVLPLTASLIFLPN